MSQLASIFFFVLLHPHRLGLKRHALTCSGRLSEIHRHLLSCSERVQGQHACEFLPRPLSLASTWQTSPCPCTPPFSVVSGPYLLLLKKKKKNSFVGKGNKFATGLVWKGSQRITSGIQFSPSVTCVSGIELNLQAWQ